MRHDRHRVVVCRERCRDGGGGDAVSWLGFSAVELRLVGACLYCTCIGRGREAPHRKLRRRDITPLLWTNRRVLVALILSLGQSVVGSMEARGQEKRIIICYVERDLNNLPPLVAEAKGYFREAGFATQIVQVRTAVSTAAILSGAIDYHTSFASTIQRAMQGAPLRGLLTMVERPNFYLVSRPEIRTVADLRG